MRLDLQYAIHSTYIFIRMYVCTYIYIAVPSVTCTTMALVFPLYGSEKRVLNFYLSD